MCPVLYVYKYIEKKKLIFVKPLTCIVSVGKIRSQSSKGISEFENYYMY